MVKAPPGNNNYVMILTFLMTSSCILGSVWVKKAKTPNFFILYPNCLKVGINSS